MPKATLQPWSLASFDLWFAVALFVLTLLTLGWGEVFSSIART